VSDLRAKAAFASQELFDSGRTGVIHPVAGLAVFDARENHIADLECATDK
jgi:hypothetical protein